MIGAVHVGPVVTCGKKDQNIQLIDTKAIFLESNLPLYF